MTEDKAEELLNALQRIRIELAALVPNPSEVTIDDWPLKSSADRYCVDAAWRKTIYILEKYKPYILEKYKP